MENSERDGNTRHLICLSRNLYAGQEATVRTGRGTTDWFQIGKGVHQGCILSLCLFILYAEYIMRNSGLDESQAGIKIAGININNLRYADDTTLKADTACCWGGHQHPCANLHRHEGCFSVPRRILKIMVLPACLCGLEPAVLVHLVPNL